MSITAFLILYPNLADLFLMKPISNEALWATNGLPPIKVKNSGKTSLAVLAPLTISLVIPVSLTILGGITVSGFIRLLYLSTTSLFFIKTAPISVILSFIFDNPVVSISKTTNSSSKT